MSGRVLVWFRRDLRVHDNPALAAARAAGDVVPVFIFDEALLQRKVFGATCVAFMVAALRDLAASLEALGCPLQWRIGDPREEIPRMARDLRVDAVYWNRDYEPEAVRRDRDVATGLATAGVAVHTCKDHLVFEPDEIRNVQGQTFQRYSAFRSAWWKRWFALPASERTSASSPSSSLMRPSVVTLRATLLGAHAPLPSSVDLGYEDVPVTIDGGEHAAHTRLRAFVEGALHRYSVGRNRPAVDETSVLSPHFRFGTLSPRTAIRAALDRLGEGGAVSRTDVHVWIDELIWREFFLHVMAGYSHVVDGPFRPTARVAPSRPDDAVARRLFQAWCDGRTGYPLVDAGMRQVNRTGWMHNRVRMVVASFLVKDLRLDWRWGERYFMQRLLDADLGVNNGNWQWCASTGTDAMPGYRIFHPELQGKKFDPGGDYVRRYVSELAAVPTAQIHAPHRMSVATQADADCRIGVDYPAPVVEHERAREEYLALTSSGGASSYGG
ncbi:MAG: deoxyribodipyrimidine photo-lyase [Nitrospiraceae bacterium]